MKNLIEENEFTANVSVPEGGVDARRASSLYPAFQALANRTQNLASRFPVTDFRRVNSLDDLADVADMKVGEVVLVAGSRPSGSAASAQLGLYIYQEPGGTYSVQRPDYVKSTKKDGRWANLGVAGQKGKNHGVATLGDTGRIPGSQLGRDAASGVAGLDAEKLLLASHLAPSLLSALGVEWGRFSTSGNATNIVDFSFPGLGDGYLLQAPSWDNDNCLVFGGGFFTKDDETRPCVMRATLGVEGAGKIFATFHQDNGTTVNTDTLQEFWFIRVQA